MPVENERKIVLRCCPELINILEYCWDKKEAFYQTYLFSDDRQAMRLRGRKDFDSNEDMKYVLTYKINLGGKVLEFEQAVEDIFEIAGLQTQSQTKLNKVRYTVFDHKIKEGDCSWEVDIFYRNDEFTEPYFAMAELEFPETMQFPGTPSFLQSFELFTPEKDDVRFSSSKLADVVYANRMLAQIRNYGTPTSLRVDSGLTPLNRQVYYNPHSVPPLDNPRDISNDEVPF